MALRYHLLLEGQETSRHGEDYTQVHQPTFIDRRRRTEVNRQRDTPADRAEYQDRLYRQTGMAKKG